MTDSPDYRLYLNERFEGLAKHINAQFENVHERLEVIKEQTTKTNSRVNHLEDDVDTLREKLVAHPVECSKAKDIDTLKEDLIEYKFIKKYPKLTAILLAFFVIALLISAYGTFSTIHSNIKDKDLKETVDIIKENTR